MSIHRLSCLALVAVAGIMLATGARPSGVARAIKARTFDFTYRAEVRDVEGKMLDVWLPYPRTNEWQETELIGIQSPWPGDLRGEAKYDNRMVHFRKENPGPGPHVFSLRFRVRRKERIQTDIPATPVSSLPEATREALKLYLQANRLVPISGEVAKIASRIAPHETESAKIGRGIYDYVIEAMRYAKEGTGWGNGSTEWACQEGYGNCTDYHALFISLVRARGIPARFSIGFPLPVERGEAEIGGYHCWADFYVEGHGWVPVDVSEADKHPELRKYYFGAHSENRVELTVGRDLILDPPQKGAPLNYFVYPYAEVDGIAHHRIDREFRFRDIP